jgi:hypothetical protein
VKLAYLVGVDREAELAGIGVPVTALVLVVSFVVPSASQSAKEEIA